MTEKSAPFDVKQANQWFAIELNNLAWDLVEADHLAEGDEIKLVHTAHAACYHWAQIGKPINQLRALVLLTTTYLKLKQAENALRYAELTVSLLHECKDEITPFDEVCVLGSTMRSYEATKRHEKSEYYRCQAYEAINNIHEPDEKQIIEQLYGLN